MRSFGRYEFVGADTAVEGFPHINDVYHNISLGVPERYRAESGVTITANKGAGLSAGIACKQQFIGTAPPRRREEGSAGFRLG